MFVANTCHPSLQPPHLLSYPTVLRNASINNTAATIEAQQEQLEQLSPHSQGWKYYTYMETENNWIYPRKTIFHSWQISVLFSHPLHYRQRSIYQTTGSAKYCYKNHCF